MDETFNEEMFKTVKKGGYDKEDVKNQFQILRAASASEKEKLNETIKEKDTKIAELNDKINELEAEISSLKRDIQEKYQSYIDNYNSIGQIIYEAKIQSQKTADEANAKKEKILSEAETLKKSIIEEAKAEALAVLKKAKDDAEEEAKRVKGEVEGELAKGRRQYQKIREKTDGIMGKLNTIQKELMSTFKAIHEISSSEEKSGIVAENEDDNADDLDDFGEVIKEDFTVEIPDDYDAFDTHEIDFKTLSEELEKLSKEDDENTDN